MKRKVIASLFLALLTISFISAIEFDMKEEFRQSETLLAKLSGDFINPPIKQNIFFYRGHVKTAVDAQIARIGEDYYIYAQLAGKAENNYSIVIEGISYKKAGQTIEEDLTKNFSITGEIVDFTVNPGFISTKDDFSITLENLKDEDLEVSFEISTLSGNDGGIAGYGEGTSHEVLIDSGEETIDFKIDLKEQSTIKLIEFSSGDFSYSIPVHIFVDDFSEQTKTFSFEIKPDKIDLEIPTTGDQIERLIYIYNTGTGSVTNLRLDLVGQLKPYVALSEDNFGRVLPGSNANLNLLITPSSEKTITGELVIESEQSLTNKIPISITFKKDASTEDLMSEVTTDDNCADLGHEICSSDQTCSNTEETVYANDGICCIGTCGAKASGSWGTIIGFILLIIVVAAAWIFFKNYKSVKTPVNLLKIAKGKKK